MASSPRKKRLYLVAGLMVFLVLGLLWHAGMIMQGSRSARRADAKIAGLQPHPAVVTKKISASVNGEAHAAEGQPPAVVTKKLPPMPPAAPQAEPPPAAPAPEPLTVVQETPKQPPAAETAPPVAAASPAPEAPRGVQEKPIDAKPVEPPPAATATPAVVPIPAPAAPPAPPAARVVPVPPKKPEPMNVEAKAPKSERGAYPFSLLLSSNRGRENALSTLPGYRRKGLAPYLVHTDLGEKGKWWRTLFGHYRSLEEALQAQKALNIENAVVVKTPFANLIGDYPSANEAAETAVRLTQKGLFPYVVKGTGDTAQLLVGAFPTQTAAEQQQRELEGQGIVARTIRR
jgi:cell division septation protein DedD